MEDLAEVCGKISAHSNPADAGRRSQMRHINSVQDLPEEIAEVDSGAASERVPSPDAKVDVEKVKRPRPWIALELDLGKAGQRKPLQDTAPPFGNIRIVDAHHIGTRPTEVHRMLSHSLRYDRGDRPTIDAQGREGKLRLTAAGNELLYQKRLPRHQRTRLVVSPQKFAAIV